jgi:hypothetical protein
MKFSVVFLALSLALSSRCVGATLATFNAAEQEVIEALLSADGAKKHVIREAASVRELYMSGDATKFAVQLREQAQHRSAPFRQALEDFLKKNRADVEIVFEKSAPKNVEFVSDATLKQIFSATRADKLSGWDLFYQRFPDSYGLVTISRVGIDSKGTVAIVYLGRQILGLAGSGGIRILKRDGTKWVLTGDFIGTSWDA